ncbi:hypothetical protein Vretimale_1204 [Volvox reticuliferus]|uniref:Uncharacterized protein n=1 Tax=Volvox reticuliferus TaxID=1737510 RepID=A0A8J4D4B7_9CHLO|nr:hypothetical protein Vretifemale_10275 [Volvox reticuliferus]GIL95125.1 hypothetical protein Vretimale_1204 [Volvox reticuliferus]
MTKVTTSADIWIPDILDKIVSFLPANETPSTIRLVNKLSAQHFSGRSRIRLALPSPTHAFKQRWGHESAFRPYNIRQRHLLLRLTAATGSISNLEIALTNAGCAQTVNFEGHLQGCCPVLELMAAAASAGHLHVVQWLRRRGCPWGTAMAAAAEAGHLEVCQWLLSSGCSLGRALVAAAYGGQRNVCQWLLQEAACSWEQAAARAAAATGHVDLMDWLLHYPKRSTDMTSVQIDWQGLVTAAAQGCDLVTLQRLHRQWVESTGSFGGGGGSSEAAALDHALSLRSFFTAAIESARPDWREKVEWLRGLGYRADTAVFACTAALPDAVDRLAWLRQQGHPLDSCVLRRAAAAGNLAAVQYLMALGVMPLLGAFEDAAEGGHLGVLQVLFTAAVATGAAGVAAAAALRAAARAGHLPIITWLVEVVGAEVRGLHLWPGEAYSLFGCTFAAGGSTNTVPLREWLLQRGCAWSHADFRLAAYHGNVEALEWLVEQGYKVEEVGPSYDMPLCHAATHGDLATLRCLRRLGCNLWGHQGDTFTACVSRGAPLEVLQWLVSEGCPLVLEDVASELEDSRSQLYRREVLAWLGSFRDHLRTGRRDVQEEAVEEVEVREEVWETAIGMEELGSLRAEEEKPSGMRQRLASSRLRSERDALATGLVGEEVRRAHSETLRRTLRDLLAGVVRAAWPSCLPSRRTS